MAKSLKSKWKRKMRAIKRERYGKKELDRLKKMLGLNTTDVEMKEEKIEDIAIVRDANELKNESIINVESEEEEEETKDENKEECEPMDDGRRVYNKKTLKDQHGNYPVWLSSRKIKKIVKKNNLSKRVQKKRGKK
ncbi:protein LLP homolog [Homalodisca vitripennis]|uniref:protein LLP homolog n=1 Tax=Homalodisca vitripennis TaxID=197043 RepID=UPI001EEC2F0E|nr:protein LLP homolog [Homalodisca vitripennis]